MSTQTVKVTDGDALVIPESVRRELGLEIGDSVVLEIDGGELRLRSRKAAIAHAQKLVRQLVPEKVSLADELIEDRRNEAARERSMPDRFVGDRAWSNLHLDVEIEVIR